MGTQVNSVYLAGRNAKQAAKSLHQSLDDAEASPILHQKSSEVFLVWVEGYTHPKNGLPYQHWFIDTVKGLDTAPTWAVVTHANQTEDAGHAWVLKRHHNKFMDLIDVVVGHGELRGNDTEAYMHDEHGVHTPPWVLSPPTSSTLDVGDVVDTMVPVPDSVVNDALDNYPVFDRIGTLTSATVETQPETRDTTVSPTDEKRSIQLSSEQYGFLISTTRNYTNTDSDDIEAMFEDMAFTGTWSEFTNTFRVPLEAVQWNLYDVDIPREEHMDLRRTAKELLWQSAIDWHR